MDLVKSGWGGARGVEVKLTVKGLPTVLILLDE